MAQTTSQAVETIGGYTVKRHEPLERLGIYLELEHQRTGARHIHIESPDENNGFAVFFPTAPKDSTGVAHILEHVVLAGSERYPVRDPFFSMTRRSLATFLNALTGDDWTMYLFSTRNAKDFANLLDVYLDATFFPRLTEDAFKQEGIRFEFEDPGDPKSGLRYRGVVFNEMKGALATPGAAMERAIGKSLFPGLPYEHVSGGDPEHIPELTGYHTGGGQDQHGEIGPPPMVQQRVEQLSEQQSDDQAQHQPGRDESQQSIRVGPSQARGAPAEARIVGCPEISQVGPLPVAFQVRSSTDEVLTLRDGPIRGPASGPRAGLRGPYLSDVGQRALDPHPQRDTRACYRVSRPVYCFEVRVSSRTWRRPARGAESPARAAARRLQGSARPSSGPASIASSERRSRP